MQSVLDRTTAYSNYMRVMPLGASITSGYGSSDGNGYRQILKDALSKRGLNVNYVGTQHSGNMTDDANEAYGGLRIEQAQAEIAMGLKYLPSVVLILLGSNGMQCQQQGYVRTWLTYIPRYEPGLRRPKCSY